jgi:hypothetical protein
MWDQNYSGSSGTAAPAGADAQTTKDGYYYDEYGVKRKREVSTQASQSILPGEFQSAQGPAIEGTISDLIQ